MRKKFCFLVLLVSCFAYGAEVEKSSDKVEVVALKNNLLYDAAATPNLQLEIRLSPKWSMELGAGFNPFPLKDTSFPKWRHVSAWIAPRYWFCHVFNRGFFSFNAAYAHYNVAGDSYPISWMYKETKDNRYQGDAVMAGISFGWHFAISPHFGIELEGGADAGYSWYDQFECKHCGLKRNSGGRWFVLPKVGVNVSIPLGGDELSFAKRCDCEQLEGLTPFALRPGYMLLKPGASFYGNGHAVQMNYLAAEKRFTNQRYSMTSFPFNYSKADITVTGYDGVKDSLILQTSPFNYNTYQYAGAARSAKDYVFQTDNSSLWLPIDTLNRTATDGYLMDFGTTLTDTVLRFTSVAPSGKYIYTEENDDKVIYLTQYDHRQAGTGESLDFTSMENMGWNMKGLPWLVTNYRTDTILWEDNFLRQMYIPHVLYQMDGAGDYITEGDNVYTSRSWDRGTVISMGNAFFTQTATPRDTETVIFHIPYYGRNEKASRPILRLVSHRPNNMLRRQASSNVLFSDIVSFNPDPNIDKTVGYTYGRDGVKWLTSNRSAQVYLLDSKRTDRISLLGAAPTEVDIPLGVSVPDSLDNATFSFDLPEKEAFNGYRYVWLIDYLKNRTINLLESDYEAELPAGTLNTRFAVRIGGFPMTDSKGKREYLVFTFDGMLYVRGLVPSDRITVYSATGQIITSDIASDTEWSTPLSYQASYVVLVNDTPTKVVNL